MIRMSNTKNHRPRYLLNPSDFHHIWASATVTPTTQMLYINRWTKHVRPSPEAHEIKRDRKPGIYTGTAEERYISDKKVKRKLIYKSKEPAFSRNYSDPDLRLELVPGQNRNYIIFIQIATECRFRYIENI
jgi:hypothetical protein